MKLIARLIIDDEQDREKIVSSLIHSGYIVEINDFKEHSKDTIHKSITILKNN